MNSKLLFYITVLLFLLITAVWFLDDPDLAFEPVRREYPEKDELCIQVITPARHPETDVIVNFPTPCDVPEGWVIELAPPSVKVDEEEFLKKVEVVE
jgi:hypothetical protein